MDKNFCIVIFSHADSEHKEEILFNSLNSIKKLNLKIILVSHIPVSERNQNLCDYFIKDDNNLILKESDIFENPCDISKITFNTTDFFGGLKFETYVYKKTYQPGVLNLYISACNLAKLIGFKNIIFWEYDYVLGDNSLNFFHTHMESMLNDNLDSISFNSQICIYNNDILQTCTNCTYAAPNIFNVDKFLESVPKKYIETAKDYNETTNLMILEQWFKENITNKCENRIEYSYGEYDELLPDTLRANITSQNSYLFLHLKSGLYFDDKSCVLAFNNSSTSHISSNFKIFDVDRNLLFEKTLMLYPHHWSFDSLDNSMYERLKSENGCIIVEEIEELESSKIDVFEYVINRFNFDFVSKLKRFS